MSQMPNPPELVLLKAMWAHGPQPAKPLHDLCAHDLDWTFSSTRKTLERMAGKGFIRIDTDKSPTRYAAAVSKPITLARMTSDLFKRVLEIDGQIPADAFSDCRVLSDEEYDEFVGLL